MSTASRLVRALAVPETVDGLDGPGWTALVSLARAEALMGALAERLVGRVLPAPIERLMEEARRVARHRRTLALWEAEMARRALAGAGIQPVLLKGTAYAAAGLEAAIGRSIGDLDILLPREQLGEAEAALLAAGWEPLKVDRYDDAYYRRWMHELPPLIHRERDRMIDVHHTILPLTARPRPRAEILIEDARTLASGLRVLSPEHMVIHAAAHLIADGDLTGGLRNLWDIDRLFRAFLRDDAGFALKLFEAARQQDLLAHTVRALRLAWRLYATPMAGEGLPNDISFAESLSDRFFIRRLLARDGWGRGTRPATRLAFTVRSHWMRMPPLLLARHLWVKLRR